jgi:hypothetical protein
MAGMQEEFTHGNREALRSTRPNVNYVKDFERRAQNDPQNAQKRLSEKSYVARHGYSVLSKKRLV